MGTDADPLRVGGVGGIPIRLESIVALNIYFQLESSAIIRSIVAFESGSTATRRGSQVVLVPGSAGYSITSDPVSGENAITTDNIIIRRNGSNQQFSSIGTRDSLITLDNNIDDCDGI